MVNSKNKNMAKIAIKIAIYGEVKMSSYDQLI